MKEVCAAFQKGFLGKATTKLDLQPGGKRQKGREAPSRQRAWYVQRVAGAASGKEWRVSNETGEAGRGQDVQGLGILLQRVWTSS